MNKLFLFVLGVASLGACKKNNETGPDASRTDLLTAKSWRMSAATITVGANKPTDEYAATQACERDNFIKFKTNKSVVVDEGATRCDPSDSQTQESTWDFNSDQTKLTIPVYSGFSIAADIVELSATTLHVRYIDTSSAPTETYDYVFTSF
jgi:hypothetical protein